MTKYLISAVLFALISYGLIKAWPLLAGPSISIISPANNSTFTDGIVNVSGRVARAATIMLNGMPLLHDQSGGFSSTLTFPRGGFILTFTVTDRFGKHIIKTRTIFVP